MLDRKQDQHKQQMQPFKKKKKKSLVKLWNVWEQIEICLHRNNKERGYLTSTNWTRFLDNYWPLGKHCMLLQVAEHGVPVRRFEARHFA